MDVQSDQFQQGSYNSGPGLDPNHYRSREGELVARGGASSASKGGIYSDPFSSQHQTGSFYAVSLFSTEVDDSQSNSGRRVGGLLKRAVKELKGGEHNLDGPRGVYGGKKEKIVSYGRGGAGRMSKKPSEPNPVPKNASRSAYSVVSSASASSAAKARGTSDQGSEEMRTLAPAPYNSSIILTSKPKDKSRGPVFDPYLKKLVYTAKGRDAPHASDDVSPAMPSSPPRSTVSSPPPSTISHSASNSTRWTGFTRSRAASSRSGWDGETATSISDWGSPRGIFPPSSFHFHHEAESRGRHSPQQPPSPSPTNSRMKYTLRGTKSQPDIGSRKGQTHDDTVPPVPSTKQLSAQLATHPRPYLPSNLSALPSDPDLVQGMIAQLLAQQQLINDATLSPTQVPPSAPHTDPAAPTIGRKPTSRPAGALPQQPTNPPRVPLPRIPLDSTGMSEMDAILATLKAFRVEGSHHLPPEDPSLSQRSLSPPPHQIQVRLDRLKKTPLPHAPGRSDYDAQKEELLPKTHTVGIALPSPPPTAELTEQWPPGTGERGRVGGSPSGGPRGFPGRRVQEEKQDDLSRLASQSSLNWSPHPVPHGGTGAVRQHAAAGPAPFTPKPTSSSHHPIPSSARHADFTKQRASSRQQDDIAALEKERRDLELRLLDLKRREDASRQAAEVSGSSNNLSEAVRGPLNGRQGPHLGVDGPQPAVTYPNGPFPAARQPDIGLSIAQSFLHLQEEEQPHPHHRSQVTLLPPAMTSPRPMLHARNQDEHLNVGLSQGNNSEARGSESSIGRRDYTKASPLDELTRISHLPSTGRPPLNSRVTPAMTRPSHSPSAQGFEGSSPHLSEFDFPMPPSTVPRAPAPAADDVLGQPTKPLEVRLRSPPVRNLPRTPLSSSPRIGSRTSSTWI